MCLIVKSTYQCTRVRFRNGYRGCFSDFHFAEELGGFFGEGGVYFKPGAELEAAEFGQTGQDFNVPAEVAKGFAVTDEAGVIARRGMNVIVIRWVIETVIEAAKDLLHGLGKSFAFARANILKKWIGLLG